MAVLQAFAPAKFHGPNWVHRPSKPTGRYFRKTDLKPGILWLNVTLPSFKNPGSSELLEKRSDPLNKGEICCHRGHEPVPLARMAIRLTKSRPTKTRFKRRYHWRKGR